MYITVAVMRDRGINNVACGIQSESAPKYSVPEISRTAAFGRAEEREIGAQGRDAGG